MSQTVFVKPQHSALNVHESFGRTSLPSLPRPANSTTNRPIESAPDKPNALTAQISAGALHDWDLAFIGRWDW
jgi:hypothetical protein